MLLRDPLLTRSTLDGIQPSFNIPCFNRRHSSVYFDHHPLAGKQIEDSPKDASNECAGEDDDVVWHAEVGRREIDEQRACVNAPFARRRSMPGVPAAARGHVPDRLPNRDRRQYCAREVPSALRVGRMLGVSKEGLAYVHGDVHRLSGREMQEGLHCRGSSMRDGRDIC
jgi:hypothetical protein